MTYSSVFIVSFLQSVSTRTDSRVGGLHPDALCWVCWCVIYTSRRSPSVTCSLIVNRCQRTSIVPSRCRICHPENQFPPAWRSHRHSHLSPRQPLNGSDTLCFFIHQVMDICFVSSVELVSVELWSFARTSVCGHKLLLLSTGYLGEELLRPV